MLLRLTIAFVVVYANSAAVAPKPEVKSDSADAHYHGPAGHGSGYHQQPQYQQYPVYEYPNYDVNYCSVHASFPLIDSDNYKKHYRAKRSGYGMNMNNGPNYNQGGYPTQGGYQNNYDNYQERPRKFDRQACRHTAIFSQTACDNCCKVASRVASANATAVVGALFVFDPDLDWDNYHKHHKDDNKDQAVQCVCCAPRRV